MSLPNWAQNTGRAGGGRVAKSAAITVGSGAVRFIGSIGTAIILGRLLSPNDFGLVGMVAPVMAVVGIFADAGVSYYTLQSKDLNHKDMSLTFWIGACMATLLFVLLFLASPLVSMFYGEERLGPITAVIACSMLITIFTAQHNALVKKCFRQDLYAVAEIVGSMCGLAAGVGFALSGAGYWSLVAIPIARHSSHAIVIWSLTRWIPGKPTFDKQKTKTIMIFGWHMMFGNAIVILSRNIDKVLIGWKFGAQEVGYYAMAYSIMMLPFLQVLTPVGGSILPYFSQIRENAKEFNVGVCRVVGALGMVVAPLMIWAALVSKSLLVFFLGEQWAPAAEIFSMLALASVSLTFTMPLNWALVASGQPSKLSKWSAMTIAPIILAYAVGLSWSGVGVASAYFVIVTIFMLVFPLYVAKHIPVLYSTYIVTVLRVVVASLGANVAVYFVLNYSGLSQQSHIMALLLSAAALFASLPLAALVAFGPKQTKMVINLVRSKLQRTAKN